MRKQLLLMFSLLLIAVAGAWAQGVTSAAISGYVFGNKSNTDAEKKATSADVLPGATIIAVHVPTGTQYGTLSRTDGRYIFPNVRVGGPYKITVSFVGYETQTKEYELIALGATANVDFAMAEAGTQLSEVVVSGAGDPVLNSDRTGALTNISNTQILRLPTISRSFSDYIRLTPQANGNAFGGRSDSYNNITVDGALFNNAFGLSSTIGGQASAQPISLDAIDQITTSIAPYDVTQGSFTGAGVNMVTRSGTNDVTGSVYYFTRNQSLVGKKYAGVSSPYSNFSFNNVGFRVGGPIIKNKVFFFANYERERQNKPGTTYAATRNGSTGSNVSQVQATDLDALSTFLQENYGYDPGPYENYKLQQNSDKATFKLDWNISSNHKFTIKYNYLKSYADIPPSNSGALSGTTRQPGVTGLPFLGAYYRINNNMNSVIAELSSTFGSKFSNKFQIGYSALRDFRATPNASKTVPLVDIGNGSGGFLTAFGYEPFSAYNILNTNIFQVSDNFDVYLGKHTLTVGTYNEFYHTDNGFDPFYYGAYQFNSLSDFYASAAGTVGKVKQYQLGYSATSDGHFPLVSINPKQLGLYGQDKYEISEKLNVTLGLRADLPVVNANIAENAQAATYSFRDGATIHTSQVQKSQVMWSPRVGFNWDVKGDRSTQVRGGTGIFTGRVPFVWISNQASNNGLLFGSKFYSTANATAAGIVYNPDVNAYRPTGASAPDPTQGTPAQATYNLAVTDRNFKFPQVWRSNIGVDQKLPGGVLASFDFAFTKDINAVYVKNINLPNAPTTANGADNRPIFYTAFPAGNSNSTANTRLNPKVTDAELLANTNKGYSYFATAKFEKSFDIGLYASLAYTYTQAKSVNDGGSVAATIWSARQVSGDPNATALSYSNYLLKHRIIASLNYKKEYLNSMATSIGMFYSLAQSGRFSYVYSGDMNGDQNSSDLIYVPNAQSDIILQDITNSDGSKYTAAQQWTDLDNYISQDKYLSKHRGGYAERNGGIAPFRGQLDFRLLQDFYIKVGSKRNTLQLSVDIINVGNMFNSNWGVLQTTNRSSLLTFRGYDANRNPLYTFPYLDATNKVPLTSTFKNDPGLTSRWQMQFGVRYIFN